MSEPEKKVLCIECAYFLTCERVQFNAGTGKVYCDHFEPDEPAEAPAARQEGEQGVLDERRDG